MVVAWLLSSACLDREFEDFDRVGMCLPFSQQPLTRPYSGARRHPLGGIRSARSHAGSSERRVSLPRPPTIHATVERALRGRRCVTTAGVIALNSTFDEWTILFDSATIPIIMQWFVEH
jgi:hypothetical protein